MKKNGFRMNEEMMETEMKLGKGKILFSSSGGFHQRQHLCCCDKYFISFCLSRDLLHLPRKENCNGIIQSGHFLNMKQ